MVWEVCSICLFTFMDIEYLVDICQFILKGHLPTNMPLQASVSCSSSQNSDSVRLKPGSQLSHVEHSTTESSAAQHKFCIL